MTGTRYQVDPGETRAGAGDPGLVPGEPDSLVQRVRQRVRRWLKPAPQRGDLHAYWRTPDARNAPSTYLDPSANARSEMLVGLVRELVPSSASILELGCNAGRNLGFLQRAGYERLHAIEISTQALEHLRQSFPEFAASWQLWNEPLEEALPTLPTGGFDLVFTMAVLEHLHTESEGVFDEIARVTGRYLITVEDEHKISWRHFPRNYQREFERRGLRQISARRCDPATDGLSAVHIVRVFDRESAGAHPS